LVCRRTLLCTTLFLFYRNDMSCRCRTVLENYRPFHEYWQHFYRADIAPTLLELLILISAPLSVGCRLTGPRGCVCVRCSADILPQLW
jgi:hypothetical protein